MCPGGQNGTVAGNGNRTEEVDLGGYGVADEFTVGNGNCGGWNLVGVA